MAEWLLIDDSPEEAAAFAKRLSDGTAFSVIHMKAQAAAAALGAGSLAPAGVLMDVDLSNEMGRQQTGPGMSQDMRVAQQMQAIPAFPIARFSLREKVLESIGRDSSSDDIFDLKIEKDGLSNDSLLESARDKLIGVREIYDVLQSGASDLPEMLGLNGDLWSQWGSTAFQYDFDSGDRVHLKASPVVRMMVHPGLLIDEDILAFRLGIDRTASPGWAAMVDSLAEYAYSGVAAASFVRWWARAIEDWWQDKLLSDAPLAGCNIDQRIAHLSNYFSDLVPLKMPKGSLGDRPWRYCLLTKEQRQEIIPVDPARAVKMRPRSPMPTWLDPLYASLGVALQNRDDPRLEKGDLSRLQLFARNQ